MTQHSISASARTPRRAALILALLATAVGLSVSSEAPPLLRPATATIERAERNLVEAIQTEDPALTAFVRRLYRATLFDELWEPNPPGLSYRWFSITGKTPAEKKE